MRVSLFVSGCTHHCKGCFNEEAWDFAYGNPFTKDTADMIFKALEPSWIAGLSLLGGEPMEPENQKALRPFLREFRARFGGSKTVWMYSGCIYEDLAGLNGGVYRWRTEDTAEILSLVDILVDGPFVESLKDISLKFRGSSNQRILDLKKGGAIWRK